MANSLMSFATELAAEEAALKMLKKGRTPEQKRVYDFFLGDSGCLKAGRKVTLEEYLQMVQARCDSLDLRSRALAKIGLDESEIQEIEPIVLASFEYDEKDDECYIRFRNGTAISNQYSVTWIFFSRQQMYTYNFTFSMTHDDTWESTNDFFYGDITCFTTQHNLVEDRKYSINKGCLSGCMKNGCKGCLGGTNVIMNHYVVDMLKITVPGKEYSVYMRNSSTIEQSLQAAKAMLREKKFAE